MCLGARNVSIREVQNPQWIPKEVRFLWKGIHLSTLLWQETNKEAVPLVLQVEEPRLQLSKTK